MELNELAALAQHQRMREVAFCLIVLLIGYVLVTLRRLGILKSTIVPGLLRPHWIAGEIPIVIGIIAGTKVISIFSIPYAAIYSIAAGLGAVLVYFFTRREQ